MKASHLKPLEQDDRLTNVKFTQPWNTHAGKKENSANRPETGEIPKVCPMLNEHVIKVADLFSCYFVILMRTEFVFRNLFEKLFLPRIVLLIIKFDKYFGWKSF